VEVRVFSTAPPPASQGGNSVAISEKEIIHRQLQWLSKYYSELLKLARLEQNAEIKHLWHLANNHTFLHTQLLFDALILGLCNVLDTAGRNQKTRDSEKITLEHFVRKLPSPQKEAAERLLKKVKSSPAYADLQKARNNFIAHSNLGTLKGYTTPEEVFRNLTLDDLGKLLGRVHEIAQVAIDPAMDFSIPGFEGVDKLLRVLQRALEG
jgi:hypothetical protein